MHDQSSIHAYLLETHRVTSKARSVVEEVAHDGLKFREVVVKP
jgi:hypothetical protein